MKTHPLFPKLKELQNQKFEIETQIVELKNKILSDLSPIKAGQIITFETGCRKSRGEVLKISNGWSDGTFAYIVKLILKDGSFGSTRTVYEYQNPTLCELPQVTKP